MITGKIKSGQRGASQIPEDVFQTRCKVANCTLVRGTLNIHVDNLNQTLSELGVSHFSTDIDNKIGPLEWWKIKLCNKKLGSQAIDGFIVRHKRTGTNYLEIMSTVNFRDGGVIDGDTVTIEVIK